MVLIPSLSHTQLAILRLTKKYSGKAISLSYEVPIIGNGKPPTNYPAFIQNLIDLDLVIVRLKQLDSGTSRFQRDCWVRYCEDMEYPSIRAWEMWREKFIAKQKGSTNIVFPGEEFERFSKVWILKIGVQAVQPNEDSILQ